MILRSSLVLSSCLKQNQDECQALKQCWDTACDKGHSLEERKKQWNVGRVVTWSLDSDRIAQFSASVPSHQTKTLNGGLAIGSFLEKNQE